MYPTPVSNVATGGDFNQGNQGNHGNQGNQGNQGHQGHQDSQAKPRARLAPSEPASPSVSREPVEDRAGQPKSASSRLNPIDVLGVRVDDVTYAEAVGILLHALASRSSVVVTTPNPEIVMLARRDPSFRDVVNRARLNIPDGIGLVLAARLQGERLREHVQGTDLVLRLASALAPSGSRWFLLGGMGDVSARAAAFLRSSFPGLRVVGAMPGDPSPAADAEVRAALRAAGPIDVLLVAYGAPKQERWLDRNLAALDIPIGIGVGGVFDYLSGDRPRAPPWVRRLHLEWLHRLITQPWRWRRMLALPHFGALALLYAIRRYMSR
jgi:N-acetylglucosaminyldiphosphoundecaprenol N-acetyl-beta-D-mannosaminyltransferase